MNQLNIPYLEPDMVAQEYKIQGQIIGSGAFSSVYKVAKEGQIYAMKCIFTERFKEHNGLVGELYQQEIAILRELDKHSKYLVRLYEEFQIEKNNRKIQCMIMEYCNCGTLLKYQQQKNGFDEDTAIQYFQQIVRGIYQFHKKNIVHRDLKLANILVQDGTNIKIADFGFCQKLTEKNQQMKLKLGTRGTQAPEIFSKSYYDIRCDMFSLGVILYQLLFDTLPFRVDSEGNYLEDIKHKNPPDMSRKMVSDDVKTIIGKMLKENPSQRLTYMELFKFKKFQTLSTIGNDEALEIEESKLFYQEIEQSNQLFQAKLLQNEDQLDVSQNIGDNIADSINQQSNIADSINQQRAKLKYQAIQYLIEIIDLCQQDLRNPVIVYFPQFLLLKEVYWEIVDFNQNHEINFKDEEKERKMNILNTSRQVIYSYLQILIGYLIYYSFKLLDSIRGGISETYQLSKTQRYDEILKEVMSEFLNQFYQQQIRKENFDQKKCFLFLLHIANYMDMICQRNKEGQLYLALEEMQEKRIQINKFEDETRKKQAEQFKKKVPYN